MKKKANRLTEMEYDEVSVVTRPANQLSKVVLFKSDDDSEENQMSDTEITEVEELETTVEDTEVAKGYGKMKKKKKMPMVEDEMSEEDMAEDEMEDEEEMPMKKGKMKKDEAEEDAESTIEIPSEVLEYIEALESANEELLASIEKMEAERDAELEAEEQEILKSADPRLVELVKSAEERAIAAEAIAKAERDFRLEREFVSKASSLDHLPVNAEEFGTLLKNIADQISTEEFDAIWNVLASANTNLSKSGIFNEVGKSAGVEVHDGVTEIEKMATRIMADNPTLTKEQAIVKAVSENPSLYNQYIREGR